MSSPMTRPRPGEPRYFVKRSPNDVSPAKMMSREEAAEMMMRTEFSEFRRRTSSPENLTSEKSTGETHVVETVAARLVAAANARAEEAERRSFETEERAAVRIAEAEFQAEEARASLEDARVTIGQLEHHVAETEVRRSAEMKKKKSRAGQSDDGSGFNEEDARDAKHEEDASMSALKTALAESNRNRLRVEMDAEALRETVDDLTKAVSATREAAKRALEARERDARDSEHALRERLRETEKAFARERSLRNEAEAISRGHETRRIRAIESVLRRTASNRSRKLGSILTSTTREGDSSSEIALTSAEEDLVAIEGEHLRELDRLRGELAVARDAVGKANLAKLSAESATGKAQEEVDRLTQENAVVSRSLNDASSGLGGTGTAVVLRTLKALDAAEARAVSIFKTATAASAAARKALDAAEEMTTNDEVLASIEAIERGLESNWVVGRDVLRAAWSVAGETRERLETARTEQSRLGARLERATLREANARVRADISRRSKAFARITVSDGYPKFTRATSGAHADEPDADGAASGVAFGHEGTEGSEAGGKSVNLRDDRLSDDPLSTPSRLTRRPMLVESLPRRWTSSRPVTRSGRSVSPGPPPRPPAATRGRSPGPTESRSKTQPRSPVSSPSRSPVRTRGSSPSAAAHRSPASRVSPTRSSHDPRSPSRLSTLTSPTREVKRASSEASHGARRRVTFGEDETRVFPSTRPQTAPAQSSTRSRVGAYIRGETLTVVSPAREKREAARRLAASAAAKEKASEAARLASTRTPPRSRTAARLWSTEPKSFRRPSSAGTSVFSTAPKRSPSSGTVSDGVSKGAAAAALKRPALSRSPLTKSPSRSPSRASPPPRAAVMASQRSPSKPPPNRDQIVSRTLRP